MVPVLEGIHHFHPIRWTVSCLSNQSPHLWDCPAPRSGKSQCSGSDRNREAITNQRFSTEQLNYTDSTRRKLLVTNPDPWGSVGIVISSKCDFSVERFAVRRFSCGPPNLTTIFSIATRNFQPRKQDWQRLSPPNNNISFYGKS